MYHQNETIILKFKIMNWNNLKIEIEKEISKSEITDKNFIKLLLKFNRKVNTLRNMILRNSLEYVLESESYNEARCLLEEIRNNHNNLYENYSKTNGYINSYNLGDYLA